jgi:hypothetical protein
MAIENQAKTLRPGEGKCIIASIQAFQEGEKDHSIFTYFLLEGLRGTPQSVDANGNITPESLARYISRAISNMTPDKRPKEIPIRRVKGSGDIILATYPHLASSSVNIKPSIQPSS